MVGFQVQESSGESVYTQSVSTSSPIATENTPKAGDGYARITYIGSSLD